MKTIKILLATLTLVLLSACGTTSTTTTTKYDTDGNVTEVTEVVADTSDFAVFMERGDGKMTFMNIDVTKVGIGQNGFSYFSGSGSSLTAPVGEDNSTSATVIKYAATLIESTKTSIDSDYASINQKSTTDTAEDSAAEEVENIDGEAEEEAESEAGE